MNKGMKNKQASIESRLAFLTFLANIIPSILLVACLWFFDVSLNLLGIVVFFLALLTLYSVTTVWQKTQFQFRSVHNLLDSLVLGDYSFRGQGQANSGAFGDLIESINALANTLQKQRLQSEGGQLLLGKIVDQIDVAIIAWDQNDLIQLINPAAKELLAMSEQNIAVSQVLPPILGFANEIKAGETQVKNLTFKNDRGKFRLHMEQFIAEGNTRNLLFMTNISNILRREEKKAWQNLIRVLSHEINNSLAPLSSLSNTLKKQVQKREKEADLAKELIAGLSVIEGRAESLADFVQSYHKISKLPEPRKSPVALKSIIEGLVTLFPEEGIQFQGEDVELLLDSSQIEQALINIIKNAVDANHSYRGKSVDGGEAGIVSIAWSVEQSKVILQITDVGEGIHNPENLFTPFYTTKTKGSGIGLVFSQQIIEAHGGYLSIANRQDEHGCVVTIELPAS